MRVAVFLLRVAVGGLLIVAGALKITTPTALAATMNGFHLLPPAIIPPAAIFLPLFELVLGAYLVIGLFTRVAAYIATAEFVVFAVAVGSVVARGLHISCGCFGPGDTAPATWLDVWRDAAFAVAALLVALGAPGAFSIDSRITRTRSEGNVP